MEGGWRQGESDARVRHDAFGPRYPLIRHPRPDAVFAVRGGLRITAEQFLRDVAALGPKLPPRQYVLNLCADRYRFAVGLAAALSRRQVTLLPPNDAALTIAALAADYPDLYCLTDAAASPAVSVPTTFYPAKLDSGAEPLLPSLSGAQPAVLLFTSGSTGRPKATPKSWGTLARSALAAGARLGAAALAGATVVGTVPHQHSYGLESTLLLALQHALVLQAERPFYPGDVAAALESSPRSRILVTTPIHISALLAESGTLPKVDLVISATAPLAHAIAVQAEARFAAPLLEIYGCSEAGQIATRRTAQESLWHCLEGISLHQDDQGTWAEGEPIETATLLHDVIELDGPTRFRLHGRTADLVNIAGKRSSLAHLDRQLTAIAGVLDGAFLMPEGEGERVTRLMAFVVAPGVAPEVILAALRERVDPAFLPRPLVLVDALPRNSLGKLPREALLRLAARNGSA
jgi:acyl-coenzyme A synthetase/AMP-(fatty) acid ligase